MKTTQMQLIFCDWFGQCCGEMMLFSPPDSYQNRNLLNATNHFENTFRPHSMWFYSKDKKKEDKNTLISPKYSETNVLSYLSTIIFFPGFLVAFR